jgi:arginine decarboxylase
MCCIPNTRVGRIDGLSRILVTNVLDEIETVVEDITPIEIDEDDPQVIIELGDLRETITIKNYREYYHDALEHREELFTLFNLGLISLEDRAKGEVLFWDDCERADRCAQQSEYVPEEFGIRKLLCAKYLANFGVSIRPRSLGTDQFISIVPLKSLNKPLQLATHGDITATRTAVDKFVDLHDVKQVLELHKTRPGRAVLSGVHAGRATRK